MKAVLSGNFVPFWSTENHLKTSLEELGVQVIALQENEVNAEKTLEICKRENPDFFLWVRTWGIEGDAFAMLNSLLCPSVAYHLDLYAGLERSKDVDTAPWWECDFVFSADGGSDEWFKSHGVNHYWSPPGVLGKECVLEDPVEEYKSEILFTGSYGYHSEWAYRPMLIDKLRERYGNRFKLIEHGSPGAPWRGTKLNQLYSSAKVVVGDSCNVNPMFKHEKYWSDRVSEVSGRGGFLIHPYVKGLELCYELEKEIVTYQYGDFFNLFNLIDFYLDHDDEREKIKLAAFERTKKEHCYTHRMQNVLDVVIHGKPNQFSK